MFPFMQNNIQETKLEYGDYIEVLWDYKKNQAVYDAVGNPYFVKGKEAVLSWCYRALQTERNWYDIFTDNYASDINLLISENYSYELTKAESKRYLRECLLVNPYVKDVTDIEVSFESDILTIDCVIHTVYGNVGMEGVRISGV